MNELKIEIPEGYEVDQEKSNLVKGEIKFKKIEKKYPLSIKEVKDRNWYIDSIGIIGKVLYEHDINQVSSESRAKAFLALMQLVELRDCWNKVDGFIPDWTKSVQNKYTIENFKNGILKDTRIYVSTPLYFGSNETRDLFFETFRDLIEEAKELL